MNTKHTPEPWKVGTAINLHSLAIFESKPQPDGQTHETVCLVSPLHLLTERDEANAERIVACVNACAGFSAQELETLGHFKAMHETIAAENERLRSQLAGRRAMYEHLTKRHNDLKKEVRPKSVPPLLQRHFKYLSDALACVNREKIDVLTIVDAGRFSEGVHVIYRAAPTRKEAGHE